MNSYRINSGSPVGIYVFSVTVSVIFSVFGAFTTHKSIEKHR
jgi:hypothetical protein